MFKLTDYKKNKLQSEVQFQYSRSSGPGGQKVNKTETRVELFWSPQDSECFPAEHKETIKKKLSNRLSKEGFLIFSSETHRTRLQNKKQCFEKLIESIEKTLTRPKVRKKTKPTRSSVEKRIKEKKQLSDKKKMRQKMD